KVLPKREGGEVAARVHREHGHVGRDLTLGKLIRTTHWAGMRKDIDEAIAQCRRCCQFGHRMQKYLLKPVFAFRPFDTVAMD
ncbi:hypothetical protein HD553DRAFT_252440, partial [Filobasidium floriforme]|uniref:uncharacterized protein n=1 Tax=Filobasidium floriforme TaxID=5210 RepID=UPI001E8ED4F7